MCRSLVLPMAFALSAVRLVAGRRQTTVDGGALVDAAKPDH
jgi:hypothetical protein